MLVAALAMAVAKKTEMELPTCKIMAKRKNIAGTRYPLIYFYTNHA